MVAVIILHAPQSSDSSSDPLYSMWGQFPPTCFSKSAPLSALGPPSMLCSGEHQSLLALPTVLHLAPRSVARHLAPCNVAPGSPQCPAAPYYSCSKLVGAGNGAGHILCCSDPASVSTCVLGSQRCDLCECFSSSALVLIPEQCSF